MSTIVVFGGTGYTGANIVREAASRGHQVIAVSRSEPKEPIPGVRYEVGEVEDVAPRVVPGADVVVAALSPRGATAGRVVEAYDQLARLSAEAGARYLQVGGFSSLRPAPDQPRFVEGEIPEPYRAEALEGEATRVLLAGRAPDELDWVFVSPRAATARSRRASGPARTGWAARSPCSTPRGSRTSPVPTSLSRSSTRSTIPATTESTSVSPTAVWPRTGHGNLGAPSPRG